MSYVQPGIAFILMLLVCGLALEYRRRGGGRSALLTAAGLLLFWSWMPVAYLLSRGVERLYPTLREVPTGMQALVVLGGSSYPANASLPFARLGEDSYYRCRYAAWQYHRMSPPPLVVAAGGIVGAGTSRTETSLARLMADELTVRGVPRESIILEPESLSTHENAVRVVKILRDLGARRVLLVTDSVHMPRAVLCFRKQGIEVTAAPCCQYTRMTLFDARSLVPSLGPVRQNEALLHEIVGLTWYWISGRL